MRKPISFKLRVTLDTTDDEEIPSKGWSYAREMIPVYRFRNPLTISEIKKNPYLQDWNALRGKFQHSYFRISNGVLGKAKPTID